MFGYFRFSDSSGIVKPVNDTAVLLSTAEVAEKLSVSGDTIERDVRLGRITPALRGRGLRGPMYFRPEDVEALAARRAGAGS